MLKWIKDHVKVSVDMHIVVAWVTVVTYAIFNHAPFSAFWPSIIALFGLHSAHEIFTKEDKP